MTVKEIMIRAWEIYRTLEGDRIAKMSMALKRAWEEAKAADIIKNYRESIFRNDPFAFRISKKQAGVIYRAFKSGEIEIKKSTVNFVYNVCVDFDGFAPKEVEEMCRMVRIAIEAIFDKNLKVAEIALRNVK